MSASGGSVTTTRPDAGSKDPEVVHPGVGRVLAWEVRKLAAQGRARWTLLACAVAPVLVVAILSSQSRPPKDTLFGRNIHLSGFAMPLLILGFAAQWVLPLLTSLVAGDIFASEDQHGTWKTILTRSVSRSQIFWAKTLTACGFALLTLLLLTTSTILASVLIVGTQPLPGLTGQPIAPGHAAVLVVASWLSTAAPLLGFTALAILLSVRTRNPTLAVVAPIVAGLVMQLVGSLGGLDLGRRLLLTTSFESWHGLLTAPRFSGTLITGLVVSAAWVLVCLSTAYVSLRRRDITGG